MIIQIDQHTFNVIVDETKLGKKLTPVLFLHGFTGNACDWNFIANRLTGNFFPIQIDLIGHGKTACPNDSFYYSTNSQIAQLKQIIEQLNLSKVVICGYSMGGRLALSFAVSNPSFICGLILESSSPGLKNKTERNERSKNDLNLAIEIEEKGIEEFIHYWMNIPLFDTLKKIPAAKYDSIINTKLKNNPVGLANSLKGFSTGKMPHFWNDLALLKSHTLLITGSEDLKFTSINKEMVRQIPNAEQHIVKGCGHNVHLENPEEFIILVNQFLNK